jgi:hypothetical protein
MRNALPRSLFLLPILLAACSAKVATDTKPGGASPGAPGGSNGAGAGAAGHGGAASPVVLARHTGTIEKLDLLFMIDNSASMANKQALLSDAVPDLLARIVTPSCLDANGNVVGRADASGACASGKPEFPAIHDLHVGVVTSSLGGRGSDACPASATNPANPALDAHNDDQGHLVTRGGASEQPVADAQPAGFLTFAPGGDPQKLVSDFQQIVSGVNEYGCGYEAQLESWYRFLVQPDPYASITSPDPATGRVSLQGVDASILKQRHDFLRPDSMLAIVVLTDENDSTVDPLAVGGQGWAYENSNFPGSTTGGGAAKGTNVCAANPFDPSCTSCAFCANGSNAAICSDPACAGPDHGYYTPQDDALNERFFHMKQRFGVDPQFPVDRYVTALTSALVPDRNGEHPQGADGLPSADYVGTAACTNPIFAASLPTDASGDLCHLPAGPRALDQVLFAVIGGVAPDLLHGAPVADADWDRILGRDPLHYDFTGADPRMLESMTARAGAGPGEWTTNGDDLEYACTFPLAAPRDCTLDANKFACDCDGTSDSPLCDPTNKTMQVRGKAYPTVRELAVARAVGDRAVVGSVCALHATEQGAGDPLFAYRPAVKAIGDQLSQVLSGAR